MYYYLSDGKNYVADNEMKPGEYILTTYLVKAKKFTYKAANNLKKRKGKKWTPFHNMSLVRADDGEKEKEIRTLGNGGAFIGDHDFEFDKQVINYIFNEAKLIIGLAGWSEMQLQTYKNQLLDGLAKYDSAESDVKHAMKGYKSKHYGKKPQAHKMSKIGYLLEDIRETRRDIKECIRCIDVMMDAITYHYTLEKLKLELSKVQHKEYQGRTEYYQMAIDILEN